MSETTTTPTTTAPAPSKTVNIIVWVLQVLAAATFVFAGVSKLMGGPQQQEGFEAMHLYPAGMYIIGVLEIAAAVGLLLPGVAGFAATCLIALMIGATVTTIGTMGFSPLVAVPLLTLVVVAIIAWVRRRDAVAFLRFAFGR